MSLHAFALRSQYAAGDSAAYSEHGLPVAPAISVSQPPSPL